MIEPNLQPLRIPAGWSVSWNSFPEQDSLAVEITHGSLGGSWKTKAIMYRWEMAKALHFLALLDRLVMSADKLN